MNNQEKILSVLLLALLSASIRKKLAKVVVLAHKLCVCNHLRDRTSAVIQVRLSSDRKKYQAYSVIENNETFESMLERMRKKVRCIPNY